MRIFPRVVVAGRAFTLGILALGLGASLPAVLAQVGAPIVSSASAQDAKPVELTQKQIDGVIASQPAIRAIEEKLPQGADAKPDPKVEAQLDAVAKKNGFKDLGEYTDVSSTLGIVMAGIDPETKAYVGPGAVIKKQIAEVEADTSMPPKEKTETLAELKAAMGPATSVQPSKGNIALVTQNFDALTKGMQLDAK